MGNLQLYEVADMFLYDAHTGNLLRKKSVGGSLAGSVAGTKTDNGYINVSVKGRLYRAHRLVWLICKGNWPHGDIDHIDGNRSNNKIENLRQTTRSENMQNQRFPRGNNKNGLLGISSNKGRWMARINVNGKQIYLGTFDSPEIAHSTYVLAKRQMHPMGEI